MEKKGVTLHNLICNVLKNMFDDFDFLEAHQDYFPKVISIKVPNYTTSFGMVSYHSNDV